MNAYPQRFPLSIAARTENWKGFREDLRNSINLFDPGGICRMLHPTGEYTFPSKEMHVELYHKQKQYFYIK